jgi:hypothetical protein
VFDSRQFNQLDKHISQLSELSTSGNALRCEIVGLPDTETVTFFQIFCTLIVFESPYSNKFFFDRKNNFITCVFKEGAMAGQGTLRNRKNNRYNLNTIL